MTCYRDSTHVRNVFCSTLSFAIYWRSTYHGKNVTRSFVKQIPCQQRCKRKIHKTREKVGMTYLEIDKKKTQKLYVKEILGDTVTQRRVPGNLCATLKWSVIILSAKDDNTFQSMPIYKYRHTIPLSSRLESKKLILQVVSAIRSQWISQFGIHVFLEWDTVYIKWECKGPE